MSTQQQPIINNLLALLHYPNEDPYLPPDNDLCTDLVSTLMVAASVSEKAPSDAKIMDSDLKLAVLSVLKKHKQTIVAKSWNFQQFKDSMVYMVIIFLTLATGILFFVSPVRYFPKFYTIAVLTMVFGRIMDYSQKKEHFYLIDFCYFAGSSILICLNISPDSEEQATRTVAFGAGILMWSTMLLCNAWTIYRLDEFCSLWIHTVPGMMAYALRWLNNEESGYYFHGGRNLMSFNKFFDQYYIPCIKFYAIWGISYYLVITKLARNKIDAGNYMTLVKFLAEKPFMKSCLDIFGPKNENEAFMMYHCIYFHVTMIIGFFCYHFQSFHTVCLD